MNIETMRSKEAQRITLSGFVVNALLTIFKFIAGILGGSSAMLADAVHSLSDFLTDIVVLVGFKYTALPEDSCHNYGHGKYETLATVVISAALVLAGFQILKTGIINVISYFKGALLPKPGMIALIAAAVSLISKELLFRYTLAGGKRIKSPAVIANAWHHRSDAYSSLGTFFGIGGAILLGTRWTVLDPLASIVVSLLVFKVAYDIFRPALDELVEKSLSPAEREHVEQVLSTTVAIRDYHKLRMRRVGNIEVIEGHILVDAGLNIKEAHDIAVEVEDKLKEYFDMNCIITLHVEPYLPEEII